VRFCGNVFSDPLPRNGHGADHIENNSCNTFPIVACAYFGRCLEMCLHVTIFIPCPSDRLCDGSLCQKVMGSDVTHYILFRKCISTLPLRRCILHTRGTSSAFCEIPKCTDFVHSSCKSENPLYDLHSSMRRGKLRRMIKSDE
jgi:hypothetical protein